MSNANVRFVGWTDSPLYKEMPPKWGSEIDYDATQSFGPPQRQTLERELHCLTKNVPYVTQTIKTQGAHITAPVISESGEMEDHDYGNGWTLHTIKESPAMVGMSKLVITYHRTPNALFQFDLPEGLSITYEGGAATIRWKGDPLETLDSGTGETGSGLSVRVSGDPVAVANYFYRDIAWLIPRPVVVLPIGLYLNEILVEEFICGPQSDDDFIQVEQLGFIRGPFPSSGSHSSPPLGDGEVIRSQDYWVKTGSIARLSAEHGSVATALTKPDVIQSLVESRELQRGVGSARYRLNEVWGQIASVKAVPYADVQSGKHSAFVGYWIDRINRGHLVRSPDQLGRPLFIAKSFRSPNGAVSYYSTTADASQVNLLPPVYWMHQSPYLRLMYGGSIWKEWDVGEEDS